MARSRGAMGVSTCGIIMMMMIMGAAAQAPAPSTDCETVVLTLADCLTFVTGSDKTPSAACCSELSSVIDNTPQCLCILFNQTFSASLGVNVTLAQQLPPACKLQTPPTSLCALVGIPVPGPVSTAAPSPAKAPSSAKTPTTAPASVPVAAGPISSSPAGSVSKSSPSAAPAGSVPESSPSASTPTASSSTTTPSPSSAPSITSLNAVVPASLLFLASIFLS